MAYLIKRTVITAARRLDAGSTADAEEIGDETQIARLLAMGAIEEVGDEPAPGPSEPDADLRVALITAINALPGEDFDAGGNPKVKALKAALPEFADKITAAVRDTVWNEMKAAAGTAV